MNHNSKGRLYLIPTFLSETASLDELPEQTIRITKSLSHFVVETEKVARQFFKKLQITIPQCDLNIFTHDKHNSSNFDECIGWLQSGIDVGLLSDAGCPAIADPGSEFVLLAHNKDIDVIPLVGPSSLILSLMASGMSGQKFSFHGYLSKDESTRKDQIKHLEKNAATQNCTQLFIETPFKNQLVLKNMLEVCQADTLIGVFCNLTSDHALIKTKTVKDWKSKLPDLQKRPCVFTIYRNGKKN
ncbi:MAG TPA: SAM-dependent methyltransferase [Bacteroidia bacterium]|nr:SAM-dependent methyltransferase [Bacteroidia bacterium]HNT80269.1 SAM-dependent methyltransferase [Bacteroidia bacterium]